MSNEFLKSNRELDEAINSATTIEEMRERMLSTLAKQGTILRDNRDAFNTRVVPQAPEPPASSLPDENRTMRRFSDTWSRYVTFDNCHFELFGNSEADLDAQEAKIRAILSAGRS